MSAIRVQATEELEFLRVQVEDLQRRLAEAEALAQALVSEQVDAIAFHPGGQALLLRQAQESLQRSEAQLAQAEQIAGLGSWTWDLRTNAVAWSPGLERIFGFEASHAGLTYRTILGRLHPEDRRWVLRRVVASIRSGLPFDFQHRILLPDGSTRILRARGQILANPDGRPVRVTGTGQDISNWAQAQEDLRTHDEKLLAADEELRAQNEALVNAQLQLLEQRHRYQDLFEFAPDSYLVTDPNGTIKEANRAAAELLGVRQDYLVGKPLVVFVAKEERSTFHSLLYRLKNQDKVRGWETVLEPRHREPVPAALIVAALIDHHGRLAGLRWLLHDITERKRIEQALIAANERLEEQVALRTEELSRVNADLRRSQAELEARVRVRTEELAIAYGNLQAELAERERAEAELAEIQRRLIENRENERLFLSQELHDGPVQDLIGLVYRVEAAQVDFPTPANGALAPDLQEALTSVIRKLRQVCGELRPPTLAPFGLEKTIRSHANRFQAEHPEVQVHLKLASDGQRLPEEIRLALFRIYQHAMFNVQRHAQARQVTVRFTFDGEQIFLEVSDDGRGFAVPDRWIDLVREGHLGLVGAIERAEAIGGTLQVISEPGAGTTICAAVPWPESEI